MSIKSFVGRHILNKLPDKASQSVRRFYYARLIRSYPESKIPAFKVIKRLVKPGDFVVDLGANVGTFTKHLSLRVGDSGRVRSIEPIPITFDILCSNVRKIGLSNVEPIHCAISGAEGSVTMQVPRCEESGENFYRARIVQSATDNSLRRFDVESRTLDSLLSDWITDDLCSGPCAGVSFIKCDVEGHELACITGAAEVIEKAHPAWFIEVSGDPDEAGSNARATVELLSEAGYGVFWFDGAILRRRRPGDRSTDYFFLMPDHVQASR